MASVKDEILRNSLRQFLQHGIREMSNQKLVELLGISTKTIYRYFKNKEGLLEEVLKFHHLETYKMMKSLPRGQYAACLFFDVWQMAVLNEYDVNNAFFRDLHYYYPELERKIEAMVAHKFTREFLRIIRLGIKEGSFRKDIIPEIVLENVYAQYIAVARSEQFKRFRKSPYDILFNTITLTIRGICTPQGAAVLDDHIRNLPAAPKKAGGKPRKINIRA